MNDTTGMMHRKVAFNGLPISNEKPQAKEESDQTQEDCYVDAFSRVIRHSTSDIYVPLPGNELSLRVQRVLSSEIWSNGPSLQPDDWPDRPFGPCWKSNLCPHVRFGYRSNDFSGAPNYAEVVDELGNSYKFYVFWQPQTSTPDAPSAGFRPAFLPVATNRTEDEAYLMTLKVTNFSGWDPEDPVVEARAWEYEFTRKFGTTLFFKDTGIYRQFTVRPGEKPVIQYYTYARLDNVTDRFGNKLIYHKGSNDSLIPQSIEAVGALAENSRTITISTERVDPVISSSPLRIRSVEDPLGNKTFYSYSDGVFLKNTLSRVDRPEGMASVYQYEHVWEPANAPHVPGEVDYTFTHVNLQGMSDAAGNGYVFGYEFNAKHLAYSEDPNKVPLGWYTSTGHPRIIKSITLPSGGVSKWEGPFVNGSSFPNVPPSVVWLLDNGFENHITDAEGYKRAWHYKSPHLLKTDEVEDFLLPSDENKAHNEQTILWQEVVVTHPNLIQESANFEWQAGMAISKTIDYCGNVTTWEYADTWAVWNIHGFEWLPPIDFFFSKYPDPTKETNPAGTKRFEYHSSDPNSRVARIMTNIVDEEGRVTHYEIDVSTGLRKKETVTGPGYSRTTEFEYNNLYKAFVKSRKIVDGAGTGKDLLVAYEPDKWGYLAKETKGTEAAEFEEILTYAHDANGNQTRVTNGRGFSTVFDYNAANRLVTVFNPDDSQRSLGYDVRGNKTTETDENAHTTTFSFDAENRLRSVIALAGGNPINTVHTYNKVGSRKTTISPMGNVTEWEYDSLQRPTQMVQRPMATPLDTRTYITHFEYDPAKNCGATGFNSSGFKPTTTILPSGFHINVTYDARYRPVLESQEYKLGMFADTGHEYDKVGNEVTTTDPDGKIVKHTYDSENRQLSTTFKADPGGADATLSKTYTRAGLELTSTNERGAVTTHEYDTIGRRVKTYAPSPVNGLKTAASPVTESIYDKAGNLSATVNPRGHRWDYEYDSRNRRKKEILPAAIDATASGLPSVRATLEVGHDPVGNIISRFDARGNLTRMIYDEVNRPTRTILPAVDIFGMFSPQEGVIVTTLDANGNATKVKDAEGNETVNTYDGLNRLLSTTTWPDLSNPASAITNEFDYDAMGNRTMVVDGEGHHTHFEYDGKNRLTKTTFDYNTPHATSSQDLWGKMDKSSHIDAAGRETTFVYDFRHRLTDVVYQGDPLENKSIGYDAAGNTLSSTLPNAPTTLGNTFYAYDFLNRVTAETSAGHTHGHEYDKAGNRTKTVYDGGRQLISTYDAVNRLDTCTESLPGSAEPSRLSIYLYDRDSHNVYKGLPGWTTEFSAWDKRGRMESVGTYAPGAGAWPSLGNTLTSYVYKFDQVGSVRYIVEAVPMDNTGNSFAPKFITNAYDGIYRLVSETVDVIQTGVRLTTYVYDRANNRVEMVVTEDVAGVVPLGELGTRTYLFGSPLSTDPVIAGSSNQIRAVLHSQGGSEQYSYDLMGNRLKSWENTGLPISAPPSTGVTLYVYDRDNRLVRHIGTDGMSEFDYDLRTRRVRRQSPKDLGIIVSFAGGLSVQEYFVVLRAPLSTSDSGTPTSIFPSSLSSTNSGSSGDLVGPDVEYIRGNDYGGGTGGILYSIRKYSVSGSQERQAALNHYNSRGDVVAKSSADASAIVTWRAGYLAFGNRYREQGFNPDPQRGNTKDEGEIGLLNEGFRFRCLATGTFITRDPVGMINGPNTYTYVSQNPWSMFDPLGLQESALSTPSAPKATPKPQWQGPYPNSPKTSPPKKLSQGPIRVSGSLDAALLTTTAPQAIHGVATTEGQNVGQNAASYALSKGYITTEQYKTVVERIGQLSAPELGMIQNASGIARQNITNQAKEIIVEAMRNNPTAGQSNPVATAQKVKETNVPLVVYRRGGDTLENYTPALKDLEHPGFGYSTTLIPSHGPNQILMPSKLGPQLESIRDGANHVSFWPKDRSRFPEWVHSRGSNPAHPFTYEVQASRIDRIKVK